MTPNTPDVETCFMTLCALPIKIGKRFPDGRTFFSCAEHENIWVIAIAPELLEQEVV